MTHDPNAFMLEQIAVMNELHGYRQRVLTLFEQAKALRGEARKTALSEINELWPKIERLNAIVEAGLEIMTGGRGLGGA
jgi:hypothetical protein